MTILTIIWFCLLLIIPGGFTILAALKRGRITYIRGWSEFLFLSFLGSFSLISLIGLISAQLGVFSLPLVAGTLLLYSLLILIIFRPGLDQIGAILSRQRPVACGWRGRIPPLTLLSIIILAGILFLRPTEYIFGGWDPGVYANTALHIERTGSIIINDSRLAFLSPEERAAFSREHKAGYREKYPGFRRSGPEGKRLIPQFYHLFPVLLAASSFPAGIRGLFYLTPLLGLLSLLAVYLTVRELWDRSVALISVFLLAGNLVEIWQARFPTAEMLSQFLLFSGLFLLARYIRRGEVYSAWLAGIILGVLLLSRISALLIFIPLGIFFYCRWFLSFRREDLHLLVPLLILAAYSLLPHLLYGAQYAFLAADSILVRNLSWLWILVIPVAGALTIRLAGRTFRERVPVIFQGSGPRWAACAIVIALASYSYLIRSVGPSLSADRTNLIELGWLLTLPGLLLGIVGVCLLILENRRRAVWLFLLIILVFAGLFLWRQLIHPYYMWAARRFAVAVIPGLLICAAWSIVRLGRSRFHPARWLAAGLFLLLAVMEISSSRILFAHREYRGAVDFMDKLAGRVRDGDLLVVKGAAVDKLPTPLDLAYGFAVLPLYQDGAGEWPILTDLIRRMEKSRGAAMEGPVVYLLTDRKPGLSHGFDLRPVGEISYHALLFERSGDHLPRRLDDQAPDGTIAVKIFRMIPE